MPIASVAMIYLTILTCTVFATLALCVGEDLIYKQKQLVRVAHPEMPAFTPVPKHPALPASSASFYLAARAARLDLTIEQFFALAFDKAPTATPAAFAALTPKQIATRRGAQHKFWLKCDKIKAAI